MNQLEVKEMPIDFLINNYSAKVKISKQILNQKWKKFAKIADFIEAYSEPSQTAKMERFGEIVNG